MFLWQEKRKRKKRSVGFFQAAFRSAFRVPNVNLRCFSQSSLDA